LLDIYDIDITDHKFQTKIKLPKAVEIEKAAISKADVMKTVNAYEDIRLKMHVIFPASTWTPAMEA
jgi:hypothetical protein